ncbi:MAG TPA: hypothetical protein DDZ51_10795 [Planctomycetaceae bacterium]|nr:hypothetical protein [Planctomycetaceae bacterium]
MKDASHPVAWGNGLILVALVIFAEHLSSVVFADEVPKSGSGKFDSASVATLENASVTESSGLAFSNLSSDLLWTHNDSGDSARLFAFDRNGKTTGGCELAAVDATDFEDMASFVQDSVARLVVADVGDNGSVRPFVSLYFFDEPPPDQQTTVKGWTRIDVRYADGPRDCEAILVDVRRGVVTLITKSFLPVASVYELPLPKRVRHNGDATAAEAQVLARVAALPIPLVTAADHDPAAGDVILTNYFQMFRYAGDQNDKAWWQSTPTAIDLPRLKQIEAVAVDRNGDVWVTSEASPTPLAKIKGDQQ